MIEEKNDNYCKEEGCNGELNINDPKGLRIDCSPGLIIAHPCGSCGRLHWKEDGSPVFNKPRNRAFLEGNKVIYRNKNNQIVT